MDLEVHPSYDQVDLPDYHRVFHDDLVVVVHAVSSAEVGHVLLQEEEHRQIRVEGVRYDLRSDVVAVAEVDLQTFAYHVVVEDHHDDRGKMEGVHESWAEAG